MFQIVCALALDLPEVLHELEQLRGVPANVQLSCEPWGHMNHEDHDCICLFSDQTGAYIHELSVTLPSRDLVSAELYHVQEGHALCNHATCSVPFMSHCAGAYGRLVLAMYVRWQTGQRDRLTSAD